MKRILTFFSFLLTGMTCFAQLALNPGVRFPEVSATWHSTPVEPAAVRNGKTLIDIVALLDLNSPDSIQTIRLLETLENQYSDRPDAVFRIRAVVKNDYDLLEKAANDPNAPFLIPVGADDNGRTFLNFSVVSVPFAALGKDGAVIWSGHPVDLEFVTDAVLNGRFSESSYRKTARFRTEMQSALRAGLPQVAAQTAEKALMESPYDSIAMQTRLYAFQLKGQYAEAADFLNRHIEKYKPDAMALYLMRLDMLNRAGKTAEWEKFVESAAVKAMKREIDSLNFAAYLLDASPRNACPVDLVLALAENAVSKFEKKPERSAYCDALEIAARAQYAACRIDRALALQEKSVSLRKARKSPYRNRAEKALNYYKRVKIISGL